MRYFSVIIPLFNKAEYIERCLQSVIAQAYSSFEIIVVNDGSTDGGEFKIKRYQNETIYLINQPNQGVSIARNNGVKYSKYDYVVFLDADDTWDPNFLFELNRLINSYPDAGIYGINHFCHYINGHTTFENYNQLFNGQKSGIITDYFKLFAQIGKSPFSNSGCCFPKYIYQNFGGYKPGVKTTEDSDLWCRIALKYRVAFCIEPLATYYLETPNNTRSQIQFKDFQVSTTLQEYLLQNQVTKEYVDSVKKLIAFQQLSLVKRAILTGNNTFAIKKIFDKRLIFEYPFNSFIHLLISLIPYRIFNFSRTILKKFFR